MMRIESLLHAVNSIFTFPPEREFSLKNALFFAVIVPQSDPL